jgi:riboflavin synthase
LVEAVATVRRWERGERAWLLELECEAIAPVAIGDSVSVDGCCLTVTACEGPRLCFELLEETVRLTRFARLAVGDGVNVERSLRVGDRMGGHFVTGHVDACQRVVAAEEEGADLKLVIALEAERAGWLVHKGSIAVNGVSLTIAEVAEDSFTIWLIPHTRQETNLGGLKAGDSVHLEYDLLAKLVARQVDLQRAAQ